MIILNLLHGNEKKEHSNDLRTLGIRHDQNGDLLSEIAAKILLSRPTVQYMIDNYKSTKYSTGQNYRTT